MLDDRYRQVAASTVSAAICRAAKNDGLRRSSRPSDLELMRPMPGGSSKVKCGIKVRISIVVGVQRHGGRAVVKRRDACNSAVFMQPPSPA
jgi:hypothetical protein